MNQVNHNFDFSLKDKVKIRAIDTTGIVNGLMVADEGNPGTGEARHQGQGQTHNQRS